MDVTNRFSFLTMSVKEELQRDGIPKTLEAAARFLVNHTSKEDIDYIKSIQKKDMIQFHHSMGTWVRNEYELWKGNKALLDDCKTEHPDDASGVILDRVWEIVHA